jgi:hypothetical protein
MQDLSAQAERGNDFEEETFEKGQDGEDQIDN